MPTNGESTLITALILALIIDPAQSLDGYQFLGWAAILAMSSKYILSIQQQAHLQSRRHRRGDHLVRAGRIGELVDRHRRMLPATLVGSLLIVRKVRQEEMAAWFVVAALVMMCVVSVVLGLSLPKEVDRAPTAR